MASFRQSPLEETVGNTPMLDFSALVKKPNVRLLAKAEWHNPGGSVKDRPALQIVRDAIARGDLCPGMTLLDATSGNTGIAYAWLGAAKGFPVTLTLSEGASAERKHVLTAYGAQLEFTDPAEATDGAIVRAQEMAASDPGRYFYADQYSNPSNPAAHAATTGPEILQQTDGSITHFVAGLGTSGTLVGVARYMREAAPSVEIAAVVPDGPLHGLEGLKDLDSAMVPAIYEPDAIDRRLVVATERAWDWCRRLASQRGLLVGVSAAAAVSAAVSLGRSLDRATIVTVLPDTGHRYLSEAFWHRD